MSNVIQFTKKKKKFNNRYLFTLEMYENLQGEQEVIIDIGDDVDDHEVFEALVGAGMRFATDKGLVELEPENE